MSNVSKVHRVKEIECPVCGAELNSAKGIDVDHQPREYDLSMCGFCTTVLVFEKDLKARVIKDIELQILKSVNPELYKQMNDTIKLIENKKGRPAGLFD